MNKKSNVPEGKINRYVFVCIGLIMYLVPCISCLGIGMASDGMSAAYILAIAAEVLAIPVGLIGINAMKKPSLRKIGIALSLVLMALHVVCAFLLGAWYVIMAPTFVFHALFIPFSAVVNEMNK